MSLFYPAYYRTPSSSYGRLGGALIKPSHSAASGNILNEILTVTAAFDPKFPRSLNNRQLCMWHGVKSGGRALLNHIPERKRTYAKRLIGLGLLVTLGFSAICGFVLSDNRDRDREQARLSAANLTATISSEIDRNLELYDLSLQAVVDGLKLTELPKLAPNVRQLLLFDRAATAKDMGSIFVLDQNGTVVIDSRTLNPRADNYAQSDFFIVHKQNPDAGVCMARSPRITTT